MKNTIFKIALLTLTFAGIAAPLQAYWVRTGRPYFRAYGYDRGWSSRNYSRGCSTCSTCSTGGCGYYSGYYW